MMAGFYENYAQTGCPAPLVVKGEPPALDGIGNRLRAIVEHAHKGRKDLQEFFGRCGLGMPEQSGAKDAAAVEAGHIHDINHGLDDLDRLVRSIVDLSGELRRIG